MRSRQDGITEIIRHHWDRRAGTFDDQEGHGLVNDEQRKAWLDLLSRVSGQEARRVLDVGCGTGFLALRFAELGHTVTGIDLAPQMIDRARRKAEETGRQIDFRVGDAAALDCADETFDLVVARHVIWNLPDPERGVAEWLRVLRPGGRLVLIEGKWGDDDEVALVNARLSSQIRARMLDAAASFVVLSGLRNGRYPRKLLNRKYRRVERQLPFSGGPPATELAEFLRAHSVENVEVEPLMDPTLWGEVPQFPRYLAAGTRSQEAVPGP